MLNKFAAVAATRAPLRRGTVSKLVKTSASLYCKSKVTYRTISIKLFANPFNRSSLSGVSTNLLENLDVKVLEDIPSKYFTSAFTTPEDDSPKRATCTRQEKKIEDSRIFFFDCPRMMDGVEWLYEILFSRDQNFRTILTHPERKLLQEI